MTPKQRHKGGREGGRGRGEEGGWDGMEEDGREERMGKRKSQEGEILIPVQSKQQKTVQKWGSPLS